jgi:hypothetical protein
MVRKQLYLTREQNERLRRTAARERRTEAEILREALDRHLGSSAPSASQIDNDPMWGIVGIAKNAKSDDASEHADDILYGGGGA